VFLVLEVGESNHRKGETSSNGTCELNQNSVNNTFDFVHLIEFLKSACDLS
jgi:hypothetical protein